MTTDEVIETTGREIVQTNGHAEPLALVQGSPTEVVERATEMADQLRKVIDQQHLYANIQGKKHVTVEGWTTLGAMVGVFPVVAWSHPILDGTSAQPVGWEARVEVRTVQGQVIGAAEAQCTRTENAWKNRDDYALRSMAQTRATSKAMRLPLAWIMSLAGFEATPAEEMPHEPGGRSAPAEPQKGRPSPPQPQTSGPRLMDARRSGPCERCEEAIHVGDRIYFADGKAWHERDGETA